MFIINIDDTIYADRHIYERNEGAIIYLSFYANINL